MCTSCGWTDLASDHHHPHDHEAHDHAHDHGDPHHHHHPHNKHPPARTVRIERDLLAKNQRITGETRRAAADGQVAYST